MAETVESVVKPRGRRPRRRRTAVLTVLALVLAAAGAAGWWVFGAGSSCDLLSSAQVSSATGGDAVPATRAVTRALRQGAFLGTPPQQLCLWTLGPVGTGTTSMVWVGVSQDAAAEFERDERLAGEAVDAGAGLKGWAWDAGGAQGVDLLSSGGDRIRVTVQQLGSTPRAGSALQLAKAVAGHLG